MLDDQVTRQAAPSSPRWALARENADRLTASYDKPPIPIHRIAEDCEVDVVFADLGKHSGTVAGFCDFKGAKLYVNREDRPDRQSFTIAHELGHWVIHRELFQRSPDLYPVLPRFASPNRADPLEKEANHFAANLLVPERLLAPLRKVSPAVLARAFGVSLTMMSFRLQNG